MHANMKGSSLSKIQPSMSASVMLPIDALCMACDDESCDFRPMRAQRRALNARDILIEMKYCGVCHSK